MNPFDNSWLLSCLCSAAQRRDAAALAFAVALQSEMETSSNDILASLARYDGRKLFIAYSRPLFAVPNPAARSELRALLQRLLCWVDTVIFVPAPTAPSCFMSESDWPEFSSGKHFTYDNDVWYEISFELQHHVLGLLLEEPLLVESGSVTVLPGIRHRGRWAHPLVPVPSLPSRCETAGDLRAAITDGLMDLATDRLAAESLNALYFNDVSFRRPYLNDMAADTSSVGALRKAILEIRIPGLSGWPLRDLVNLRTEFAEPRARFSRLLMSKLCSLPAEDDSAWAAQVSAELDAAAKELAKAYRSNQGRTFAITSRMLVKSSTLAFGATGALGSAAAFIAFLAGGGLAWDAIDAITNLRERLRLRRRSIFFAAKLLSRQSD